MTAAADTFHQIVWLLVKWALWGLLIIIVLGAATTGIILALEWYTQGRHKENVVFNVEIDRAKCSSPEHPIFVGIINNSTATIEKVDFRLVAKRKGRSTDLASYHSYEDDHIIKPNNGFSACWAVPKLKEEVIDFRGLEWSIGSKYMRFAH